jgi:pyridoxamine 5'-phosphate oxidase
MTAKNLSKMRKEYAQTELNESTIDPNPFKQFAGWFEEASAADFEEPNAMALATADAAGNPSVRMVLLKSYDDRGFVFFTNYTSQKGSDLSQNPRAALLFWWDRLDRQVRIEGEVETIKKEESAEYFRTRPAGSQLGAWASEQSSVITGREVLENRLKTLAELYEHKPVPHPPHWGGYRVKPLRFEFWQGRVNRLHDRFRYRKNFDGIWIAERLSP